MSKLLCVMNLCGLRGLERIDLYVKHVKSLLAQEFDDLKVVVSGACSTDVCKRVLHHKLSKSVSYNWTHRKYTVGITFNQTVMTMERECGPFDAHVYLDSGIDVAPYPTMLRDMYSRMTERFTLPASTRVEAARMGTKTESLQVTVPQQGPALCAMVAARPSTDQGFEYTGMPQHWSGEWLVPVGKACNLHCTAFHRSIYDAFSRVLPDIFIGDTTESTFSFLCAAVNRRWLILGNPEVHHEHSMDGPSAGHARGGWNDPTRLLLFPASDDVRSICRDGRQFGLGYEECHAPPRPGEEPWWLIHDPSKFDEQGNALDHGLLPFMRRRLYLSPETFDYSKIENVFEP